MEKWTPEQLNKQTSRVEVDAKLIKDGAKYVQDIDVETGEPKEPRLEISQDTLAEKIAFEKIFDGFSQDFIDFSFKNRNYLNESFNFQGKGTFGVELKSDGKFIVTKWGAEKQVPFSIFTDEERETIVNSFREKAVKREQEKRLHESEKEQLKKLP